MSAPHTRTTRQLLNKRVLSYLFRELHGHLEVVVHGFVGAEAGVVVVGRRRRVRPRVRRLSRGGGGRGGCGGRHSRLLLLVQHLLLLLPLPFAPVPIPPLLLALLTLQPLAVPTLPEKGKK